MFFEFLFHFFLFHVSLSVHLTGRCFMSECRSHGTLSGPSFFLASLLWRLHWISLQVCVCAFIIQFLFWRSPLCWICYPAETMTCLQLFSKMMSSGGMVSVEGKQIIQLGNQESAFVCCNRLVSRFIVYIIQSKTFQDETSAERN